MSNQHEHHLLKSKRFLPLFITQFFGAFNDNAFKNAFLIWFTYDIAEKSGTNPAMMVTIAAGLFILPFFLLSATAGQIADKYERSSLTQIIKQVEIVLMLACALFFYLENIYGLLVVLFLMGVQSTFFGPIKYSLIPEHLLEDELVSGNGLIESGTFLSILFGTIFGGLIIRTEHGVLLLSICIILFAIIGYYASRSIPKAKISDPDLKIGWNIASETWKIIGFARKEHSVWLAILGISWFWLIGATFLTQFPTYSRDVLHGNEHIVTMLLTIFSIGIGIGSMWCNKLIKGEINGRLVPYGSIGISIAILIFTIASHLYTKSYDIYNQELIGFSDFFSLGLYSFLIIFSLLMLAICAGIYIVPLYAIMQHRSDNNYLARIIAANNVLNALFMVLASIFALLLFSFNFNVTDLLLAAGIANIPAFMVIRGIVKQRLNNA